MILFHLHQPIGAWVLKVLAYRLSLFVLPRSEKRPTCPSGFDRIFVAFADCCVFRVITRRKTALVSRYWCDFWIGWDSCVGVWFRMLELNRSEYFGYLLALACAFTWSGYSVLNRRFGTFPQIRWVRFVLWWRYFHLLRIWYLKIRSCQPM